MELDSVVRHREARRRALRAAAAVASTALFGMAGCATTIEAMPANDAGTIEDRSAPSSDAPVSEVAVAVDAGAAVDAHPPADTGNVVDASGPVADGGPETCESCDLRLNGERDLGCNQEYIQCIQEVAERTGDHCQWHCLAWGPFVPPVMEG